MDYKVKVLQELLKLYDGCPPELVQKLCILRAGDPEYNVFITSMVSCFSNLSQISCVMSRVLYDNQCYDKTAYKKHIIAAVMLRDLHIYKSLRIFSVQMEEIPEFGSSLCIVSFAIPPEVMLVILHVMAYPSVDFTVLPALQLSAICAAGENEISNQFIAGTRTFLFILPVMYKKTDYGLAVVMCLNSHVSIGYTWEKIVLASENNASEIQTAITTRICALKTDSDMTIFNSRSMLCVLEEICEIY